MKTPDLFSPHPARGWLPWAALAPFLALLLIVISDLGGTPLIEPWVRLDHKGNPANATALIAVLLVPFGLLLLGVLAWVHGVERRPLASIGLGGPRELHRWLQGLGLGVLGVLGIVLLNWALGGYRAGALGPAWAEPAALLSIVLLLGAFAIQAGAEEILFRGWLLSVLAARWQRGVAVGVSAALFTLLHFGRGQPLLATVSYFLFAVFCSMWVLRRRSVWEVMGWHAGWNWLLAVGFDVPVTGLQVGIPALGVRLEPLGPVWLTGGTDGPEGSLVCVLYFLLGLALMGRRRAGGQVAG